MSPYSCPDFICDLDAEDSEFVSLKYKQDDIDKTVAYIDNNDYENLTINFYIADKKGIYGFCSGKINYKQSIKYWSRERAKYKKLMKKLKDNHLKGCNQYNDYENLYFNSEDMMNQVRSMRKNKYQEYKLNVKI
jgi:hypothetical protein